MRKFRFRFEAVETVRRNREHEALRSLVDAQRAYGAAVAHRNGLYRDLDAALERRETLGAQNFTSSSEIALETDFIAGTKARIVQAEQGIVRTRRGVEKALRAYLHARRQTRMLEVLRENAQQEFKKSRAKHEQRQLDDLYVMRARIEREAV